MTRFNYTLLTLCLNLLPAIIFGQCTLPTGTYDPYITASSGAMAPILSGENIQINSDFDIDDNTEWQNCNVALTDGITITVKSTYTLEINSGTLLSPKTDFWVGIVIEPNATLIVESSTICGAETAVNSVNLGSATAANFIITNSSLLSNETGLAVTNYTVGAHPGIFEGNTITGPLTLTGSNSEYGIEISSVGNATAGMDIGGGATNNTIQDLPIGIEITNSTVNVRQTNFVDIQPLDPALNGTAIRATTQAAAELNIGGGAAFACSFEDCQFGIDVSGYTTVNINDNSFTSTAVGLQSNAVDARSTLNTLNISDNTIDRYTDIAIDIDQSNLSMMRVRANNITGNLGNTRGINVDEHTGELDLNFNVISDVFRGIITQSVNLSGASGVIGDNIIHFDHAGTGPFAAGILIVESDDVLIPNNDVFGNCITGACTNIRGI